MPGIALAISRFQLPTTRSIDGVGRQRAQLGQRRQRHQQIADALEPKAEDPSRRVPYVSATTRLKRRRNAARSPVATGAYRPSRTSARSRGGRRSSGAPCISAAAHLIATRSTMTPSSRSSGVPRMRQWVPRRRAQRDADRLARRRRRRRDVGGNGDVVFLETAAHVDRTVRRSRPSIIDGDVRGRRRGRPSAVAHPQRQLCASPAPIRLTMTDD